MLDTIREVVRIYTSGLTDGQFFGFGLIVVLGVMGLFLLVAEGARNWRIDSRLKRKLRDMPHGGLWRDR